MEARSPGRNSPTENTREGAHAPVKPYTRLYGYIREWQSSGTVLRHTRTSGKVRTGALLSGCAVTEEGARSAGYSAILFKTMQTGNDHSSKSATSRGLACSRMFVAKGKPRLQDQRHGVCQVR